ncbi:hypothetical protein CHI10_04205 [Bacillus sp. 7894-2]|nr:hypothetical protein CHI10_04205 [Bacillus sp. 7894-2]
MSYVACLLFLFCRNWVIGHKESRKEDVRVGTRVSFGHRKAETMDLSRNLGQLRTQKGEKRPVESEPGATSDAERRKEAGRVRTWFNFGHRKAELWNGVGTRVSLGHSKQKP